MVDLCERVDLRTVNKRVLEALAKAGALQDLGPTERLLAGLDRAVAAAQQVQRAAGLGQQSLFGMDSGLADPNPLPVVPPPSEQERLGWEKEALGFFLTNHPFEAAARSASRLTTANTSQITEEMTNERVTLAGAIMRVRRIITKKQETMAVAVIEDLHGSIEAVIFPRVYAASQDLWTEDTIVIVKGRVAIRRVEAQGEEDPRGVPEILVESAELWTAGREPEEATAADLVGGARSAAEKARHTPAHPEPVEGSMVRQAHHERVFGRAPSTGSQKPMSPPPPQPSPSPSRWEGETLSPSPTRGEDDGEGWRDPPQNLACEAAPSPPPPAAGEREEGRRIAIVFRESGERAVDMDRLRLLHGALAREGGEDPYVIVFEGQEGRQHLVGDHLRTRYSAQLAQEIEGILGVGSMEITPI
jgi:DNA polymerase-3 subunit alpha